MPPAAPRLLRPRPTSRLELRLVVLSLHRFVKNALFEWFTHTLSFLPGTNLAKSFRFPEFTFCTHDTSSLSHSTILPCSASIIAIDRVELK